VIEHEISHRSVKKRGKKSLDECATHQTLKIFEKGRQW
jgi:hypothetical protein